jgi:putative SbcD/Mre11-related phosphoesterase
MIAAPVYGAPALIVRIGRERTLVAGDLHLGIEGELAKKGISLPSQIPSVKAKLMRLIKKCRADRLILLGDIKHNVPVASWQEWRELPDFFGELSKLVQVEVVRGNHDAGLEGMIHESVKIHGAHGIVLGRRHRVGLMHGHTWPSLELLNTELIVTAHIHPAIEFRDRLGGRTVEPAWLRAGLDRKKFPEKLQAKVKGNLPELLVMPAFSELVGGAAVNREIPEEFIGPMFKAGAVKIDEAEAYLLDGTFLGKVNNLRVK